MAKLTEKEKFENQLNRALKRALEKNQKEKYPLPLKDLAHNFWEDNPKFTNGKLDKEADKVRIWDFLYHTDLQLNSKI